MNWSNVALLSLVSLVPFFIWLRFERRRRWIALLALILPYLATVCFWATLRRQFGEAWTALGIAFGIAFLWWRVYGRKLPRPSSEAIKVWGQEE